MAKSNKTAFFFKFFCDWKSFTVGAKVLHAIGTKKRGSNFLFLPGISRKVRLFYMRSLNKNHVAVLIKINQFRKDGRSAVFIHKPVSVNDNRIGAPQSIGSGFAPFNGFIRGVFGQVVPELICNTRLLKGIIHTWI